MKNLLLLFMLIFGCTGAYAQPPEYFVDTWYLHSFTFENSTVTISDLEIPEGPTLIIEDDFSLHGTAFCNDYSGFYEYIDNDPFGVDDNFIPRNVVRDTQNCGDMEGMEAYFFIPFVEEKTADIYVINAQGNEKWIVLAYYSGYGYQEYKNFPALGVKGKSLKDFLIFPNPVHDKLKFQSAINHFDAVVITDINGRTVLSLEKQIPNEIDVSILKSGMYFLNIQSSDGNAIKKFIKI
ncbi:MAG: T9SS type A sorting domain-containing protein [Aequorivita sp.]